MSTTNLRQFFKTSRSNFAFEADSMRLVGVPSRAVIVTWQERFLQSVLTAIATNSSAKRNAGEHASNNMTLSAQLCAQPGLQERRRLAQGALTSILSKQILTLWFFIGISIFLASAQRNSLVLEYEDFGPQSAVYDVLGYQWFQWNTHGDPDPRKVDNIKVVVYRSTLPLSVVSRMYPVEKEKLQDYRHIDCQSALQLIDRNILEIKSNEFEGANLLLKRLKKTRARIERELGC